MFVNILDNVYICTMIMTIAYLITYVLYNFVDYFVDGFEYVLAKVPPLFFYMIPLLHYLNGWQELRNKLVAGNPIIGVVMLVYFMMIDIFVDLLNLYYLNYKYGLCKSK